MNLAARAPVATILIIIASLVLGGCAREPAADDFGTPTEVYRDVRGEIRMLPDRARPASELQIRHEYIPDFVDRHGETVGMRVMTMPFPIAPGVSLESLSVGDKVRFTFEVRRPTDEDDRPMIYRLTAIQPLPDDTELDFSNPD